MDDGAGTGDQTWSTTAGWMLVISDSTLINRPPSLPASSKQILLNQPSQINTDSRGAKLGFSGRNTELLMAPHKPNNGATQG